MATGRMTDRQEEPEVAVVVSIAEYRRLTRPAVDLTGLLLGEPALSDDAAEVFAEVEAERKAGVGRPQSGGT
jgi:hypothetical protein